MINETTLLMKVVFVAAIVLLVLMIIVLVAMFGRLKEMNNKVEEVNDRTRNILYDFHYYAKHKIFMKNVDIDRIDRHLSRVITNQERAERLKVEPVAAHPLTVQDLINRTLTEYGRCTINYYNSNGIKIQNVRPKQLNHLTVINYTKEYTLDGVVLKVTI